MLAVHAANAALSGTSETAFKGNLGYSGEQWDASLRMQNLRARAYDPRNGRFIGLDPFAGNIQDPQSLHKYAYVHGDPIQGIDPTGLSFLTDLGTTAHVLISRMHKLAHPAPLYNVEYDKGIPGTFGLRRPDITNYSQGMFGEIKPLSARGIIDGNLQMLASVNIANGVSFSYGGWNFLIPPVPHSGPQTDWIPSTWNPGITVLIPGVLDSRFSDFAVVTLGTWRGLTLYHRIRKPSGMQEAEFIVEAAARAASKIRLVSNTGEIGRLQPNDFTVLEALFSAEAALVIVGAAVVYYGGAAAASYVAGSQSISAAVAFRASSLGGAF